MQHEKLFFFSGQRKHPGGAHCPQCVGCTTTDDVSALSSTPCNKNEGCWPRERQESVLLHTSWRKKTSSDMWRRLQKTPPRKTLLVLARCASQQAQVQRTLLMPARCVPPKFLCRRCARQGEKQSHLLQSQYAQHRPQTLAPRTLVPVLARRKTLIVLTQCTPWQAQVQDTDGAGACTP